MMNLESNKSENNLITLQDRTSVSHGDVGDVSADSKNARQSLKRKPNGFCKTNRRFVKRIRKNCYNAEAPSEPATNQPAKEATKKRVKTRKCQQAKTLYSGATLSACIVPPTPKLADLYFEDYSTMFHILVSKHDLRSLSGVSTHGFIYINGKPFTVSGCQELNRGQIIIPEKLKADCQHLDPEDRTVELSAIPRKKIPEFNSIEVIIKNKNGQLLEDDHGNRLFLDVDTLQRCIRFISSNGFIFDTTREYPVNMVVAKPEDYRNRVVRAEPREFLLSVCPTAAALHSKVYGDPGKSEETDEEDEREAHTMEDFKKMNYFIYNSNEKDLSSIVPKVEHTDNLLTDAGLIKFNVEDLIFYKKSSSMKGENILNFPHHKLEHGKRTTVEIDGFYYYADLFTPIDKTSDQLKHYVNSSFHNCHAENKPLLTTVHPDKTFTPARKVEIELNWLLNDRRKVPLVGEAMSQKIRSVLKDVPLQKGRYFQVLIKLDIEIYDDMGRLKLLHNGKPAPANHLVLEGKVKSVEGYCPDQTTSDCSPGEAFRIDDQTDLDISAKDKSILNGSEPNYMDVEPYLPALTEGLIGMEFYARRIVETIIIPRKLYELGMRKTFNKGVILYGLPGNGKSEMANRILKLFNTPDSNKHKVQPGELLGSTPEKTTENFNKLFDKAKETIRQTHSRQIAALHIFLFDEFDCLFVAENKTEGLTPIQVALLGLFNTLLDSPDAPDNILCIFTTNSNPHTELASSLTRSGRISVQLKIGNPDVIARKDMVRGAVEGLEPKARIDDCTLVQVANHLMSGFNSNQVIETVKAAKEQAMFLGIKQPFELMFDHFHQALFHKNEIQERKTEVMSELNNKAFWSKTTYDTEKTKLKLTLTPLTRGLGKACLCCITANEGARVNQFLNEFLEETDGFTHYQYIDGKAVHSPIFALEQLGLRGTGGERRLIFITNTTQFINFFKNNDLNPLDFGTAWKKAKENANLNIALVLVTEDKHMERNLHDLGLDVAEVDSDSLVLPDKFDHQQMKEYLRKTYAKADASAIESMIEAFPENYPIQDFIKLANYHYEVTTWNLIEIDKKLKNSKLPLKKLTSMYS